MTMLKWRPVQGVYRSIGDNARHLRELHRKTGEMITPEIQPWYTSRAMTTAIHHSTAQFRLDRLVAKKTCTFLE